MNTRNILSPMVLALSLGSTSAFAQPLDSANAQQIIEQLAPPVPNAVETPGSTPVYRTRNLKPVQRSIDLVIQFDFDSARLQTVSKPLLDQLAEAMKSERLSPMHFRIEGHTDAKGSDSYNKGLSQRRADAVQQYLKDQGIATERMNTQGLGASQLLYPDQPQAAENRRVRIVAVPQ
jgi:outer membrane protein OmpA-like peptidoglycan-associated protein